MQEIPHEVLLRHACKALLLLQLGTVLFPESEVLQKITSLGTVLEVLNLSHA